MQETAETHCTTQFAFPVPSVGRYLVVKCGALHLAMRRAIVRGVLSGEEAAVRSLGAASKDSYRVVELGSRFEQPTSPETPETRIVLVGRLDLQCAFRVDQIQGFVDVRSHQRRPLPPQFMGAERRWFAGLFFFRDTITLLLNHDWLLDPENRDDKDPWPDLNSAPTEVFELEVASDGDTAPWADFRP